MPNLVMIMLCASKSHCFSEEISQCLWECPFKMNHVSCNCNVTSRYTSCSNTKNGARVCCATNESIENKDYSDSLNENDRFGYDQMKTIGKKPALLWSAQAAFHKGRKKKLLLKRRAKYEKAQIQKRLRILESKMFLFQGDHERNHIKIRQTYAEKANLLRDNDRLQYILQQDYGAHDIFLPYGDFVRIFAAEVRTYNLVFPDRVTQERLGKNTFPRDAWKGFSTLNIVDQEYHHYNTSTPENIHISIENDIRPTAIRLTCGAREEVIQVVNGRHGIIIVLLLSPLACDLDSDYVH